MSVRGFLHLTREFDALAARMQKGDTRATEALYNKLFHKVYGFAVNQLQDRTIAEDLTQDIFMKLVSRIETFDATRGGFLVWFWQLARNTVIDHQRKKAPSVFSDAGENGEFDHPDGAEHPEDSLDRKLLQEKLRVALSSLQEHEQELFRLRFIAELPYREIAKMTGQTEGSLRVHATRIKKRLRTLLV